MTDTKSGQPEAQFNREAEARGWPTRADSTLSFQNQNLVALAALWAAKAVHRAPRRSDFNARELKPLLRDLLIVEYVPQQQGGAVRLRVRYVGSSLAVVLGDLTGRFMDESIPNDLYPRWQAALAAAELAGHPMRFTGRIDLRDQQYLTTEAFAVRLAAEADGPVMAMAAFRFHSTFQSAEMPAREWDFPRFA